MYSKVLKLINKFTSIQNLRRPTNRCHR